MIPSLDVIRHVLLNMTDNSEVVNVYENLFICKFTGPGSLGRSQLSKVVMQKSSSVKEFQQCAKGKVTDREDRSLMIC